MGFCVRTNDWFPPVLGELITVLAKDAQRFPAPELKTQPIMHHVRVSVPTVDVTVTF